MTPRWVPHGFYTAEEIEALQKIGDKLDEIVQEMSRLTVRLELNRSLGEAQEP